MTILGIFLINQIRTGGDRRYLELLELLASRGNKVFVIMNRYFNYSPNYITKIEIPVKYTRHQFPPASYLFKKAVKKLLKKIIEEVKFIDFIHIHGDIYLKTAIFIKKNINKPLFYACRNNDIDRDRVIRSSGYLKISEYLFFLLYEQINKYRERQISKYAEIITFQSIIDRDIYCRRTNTPLSKIMIIPGNIGLPRCKETWKYKNTSQSLKNIVFSGGLTISKGILLLPKILSCLKSKGYGNIHCIILGRDEFPLLHKYIANYNVSEMITLAGYVDPFPYLVNNDLYLYPALYDAYPDSVLEALHAGCPVLASAVGGLSEMLLYPELLFEPNNIDQIVNKIEQCIINPSFYKKIKELCIERAKNHHFDWAEKFEKAMMDYLAKKNNA